MAGQDLVRPSRDGDQFHYHWAARWSLLLLPGTSGLVAVTIEGPSTLEGDEVAAGEEVIDVGLYFGNEARDKARLIRYVQLKHSTRRSTEAWTASGLEKTIRGFANRYIKFAEQFDRPDGTDRVRFEFTTNRPIDLSLQEALQDLASGLFTRHPELEKALLRYTQLEDAQARRFFSLFSAEGLEGDLWAQRNLLTQDISFYLPDADYDAPVQLKELITRKATTEFESNPSIRRYDVLRALKTDENQLQPAPCLIPDAVDYLPREQEPEILEALLSARAPIIIHADAGVGKSVLAARLARSMPTGSQAVLYDCFGDGLYRNALGFRHRHRDALVQIANELAARGLCHPLIPSSHAEVKVYIRAFLHRLAQAVGLLTARYAEASLCIIIDAADNAEMAAKEQRESSSFVRDLIRAPLPPGVRLAFTSRTHRRAYLGAPPNIHEIELKAFSISESADHLRTIYPSATSAEIAEFAVLSSSNPRVQALALSHRMPLQEMLKQLGPTPTTVSSAIAQLLEKAVARVRDLGGPFEVSQIEAICQGLAVLRPLVPITLLAQLAKAPEGAVRSFALDFGRPLLVKGDSLHFLDEPAETWFRERFQPDQAGLSKFLERLRPLTAKSSYAAATLPQLLLQSGRLDEVVDLALSEDGLPIQNPLAARDVQMQRLTFALKACLQGGRHLAATKLALKAAGECVGEQRQNRLMQANTDLAAALMTADRIEEIVSRRIFGSGWMGSNHAYDAGFLSGHAELAAEASSRLRMAMDWLTIWARLPHDEREDERVSDEDRSELSISLLRLRGPDAAAKFLRSWVPRSLAFRAGEQLARRLIDLGQYDQLDRLSEAAGNDVWLLLSLASEAGAADHGLPSRPLARLLRLLADRRIKLEEPRQSGIEGHILPAIIAVIEMALRVLPHESQRWAEIICRYLPTSPPAQLASRFGVDRGPILRAYSLEAALRGQRLTLIDIAPIDVRKHLESPDRSWRGEETEIFQREVGYILPWLNLASEIQCGRSPTNVKAAFEAALKESFTAKSRLYSHESAGARQTVAQLWFRTLHNLRKDTSLEQEMFLAWLDNKEDPLWSSTLLSLCRVAARVTGFEKLALEFAAKAFDTLESSREDAETRAASYLQLARAIILVSKEDASAYFDRAIEIASRIGDENLDRWAAFLHLATAAAEPDIPRPQTAYRLSRAAELTYEYVARDKHFNWDDTVASVTGLCASSAFAILSRWRDRRFGNSGRLLPEALYPLVEQGRLPPMTPVVFAGVKAEWDRLKDITRIAEMGTDLVQRAAAAKIGYRYMWVEPHSEATWTKIDELGRKYGFETPEIQRLIQRSRQCAPVTAEKRILDSSRIDDARRLPDWEAIFQNVDLTSADSLNAAYNAVRAYDPPYEFINFFRQALARVNVGRESELIRALTSWPTFGTYELSEMLTALLAPIPRQISFRNAVRDAVLSVCRREPARVRRKGWFVLIPFQKLEDEGIILDQDVVQATLEGFAAQVDILDAGQLFRIVDPLASCLSAAQADEALNFGLDIIEDILRPEDGDGPWGLELQPQESLISAVAGYIWAGLGSPAVEVRWQWAHVVRSAVELGWTALLVSLVVWAEKDNAAPFVDRGLEFYIWHARQWLLIGLGRGGIERPTALLAAKPLLLNHLHADHLLIRVFAAEALRSLGAIGELSSSEIVALRHVSLPSLPLQNSEYLQGLNNEGATEDGLTGDEKYYFGIDIGPYWFGPLGRAFGLTQQAIERRAREVMRRRMGWVGSRQRDDSRYTRKVFEGDETRHSHGSLPDVDDLPAYHAYHAMMFVAASLLTECHVQRHPDQEQDEFEEWLSDRLLTRDDRRWLSDQRDPCLVADPPPADGHSDTLWRWSVTRDYLDKQLASDNGMLVVWGHWADGDHHTETISVRSALVSRAGAEALVAALQLAPELGRNGLPSALAHECLEAGPLRLFGWVSDSDRSVGMDKADPWAKGLHYPGPGPSEEVVQKLGLVASKDGRCWSAGAEDRLMSETWTRAYGHGREESVPGWKLSADRAFLENLFRLYPEDCLILSVDVTRRQSNFQRNDEEYKAYPGPYARFFIMEADGVAHAL